MMRTMFGRRFADMCDSFLSVEPYCCLRVVLRELQDGIGVVWFVLFYSLSQWEGVETRKGSSG